jgi:hypothetical protein
MEDSSLRTLEAHMTRSRDRFLFRAGISVLALGCALPSPHAYAGTFDDLKQSLEQSLNQAAKRNVDAALGNDNPSAATTSHGAPQPGGYPGVAAASQNTNGSPGAVALPVAATPVDPADPACLVFVTGNDGGSRIKNRQCRNDPYVLRHSDKVDGCSWTAMKHGLTVSAHTVVAICEGRPDNHHSCECTGRTLWKGG